MIGDYRMGLGKLTWKKVVTSDGVTIGQLEGGEVDPKTWEVTHVHIGLNEKTAREFGLKGPFMGHVIVCLPTGIVNKVNDVITLQKSLQELKEMKECQEFY